ncbi:MAG TPA: tetratricopeptide repeat protein [Candidatus Angelobacter sp.]|nr:tetratricopeptide repeat protein [Candidatus Angelobacter sp.]
MGIIKVIATALLATLALPALAQTRPSHKPHPQSTADDTLKDAESLLQKQQYSQAEEKLQTLVVQQSENPQAWFDLGFAQSHQSKTAEAIVSYKKAAQLDRKWFEAQQNLGLALAKSGDLTAAASALKIAVTLKPTVGGQQALAAAWLSLAQVVEESQPLEALAAYQKAAELDPANSEAQLGVARMAERSGNAAAAEQQYLKLAATGNNDSVERLIGLYLKQKRFADAETWLRKYVAANPQNSPAQLQLGKLLAAEGKTQEAIATLEPAYKAAPDPKIARDLASLYLETRQYAAAADLLGPLVAQSPTDAQLHLDYGTALVHQLKYAQAQAVLLKAVQLKPNLVEAYFDLGYAAEQNKNYELTIRVLDARAKLQPETPATYFLRATAYDNLRMYKPAAANYKLFLGVAGGKFPDQEFQARHRLKAILPD